MAENTYIIKGNDIAFGIPGTVRPYRGEFLLP